MKFTSRTRSGTRGRTLVRLLMLGFALAPAPAGEAAGAALVGLWETGKGEARVEIAPCGPRICGEIVWLEDPAAPDGSGPKLDVFNPDPALRGQEILGLRILEGVSPAPDDGGRWSGGRVYDPNKGRTYRCYLELQEDGRLKVRGFLGFSLLGRTTYWTPVPRGGVEPGSSESAR